MEIHAAFLDFSLSFNKLAEQIRKIQNHQDEELLKFKGDEYMFQSLRKHGKLMFDYMDTNQDGFVSRDEMLEFGKIMVSNDTNHLDFWVEGNFKNDGDKDDLLTFEEFYKPQMSKEQNPSSHDEF